MVETELTVTTFTEVGERADDKFTALIADGLFFDNAGSTFLYVKNGAATTKTITVEAKGECNFGHMDNKMFQVTNAQEGIFGPFSVHRYNDDADHVHIDVDVYDANLKVAAFKVGGPVG